MTCIARQLTDATTSIFDRLGLDTRHALVSRSERVDADFQCNGALAIAKAAGRSPREIATAVAQSWVATELADPLSIAGPGFLNFRVTDAALAARAQQIFEDPRTGASLVEHQRRVLVDYGGTNVAKPMHVGHLRSSIIGESLKRIFRFRGDQVWGDVHFGDWGFQMGLMIVALEDELGGLDDETRLQQKLELLTLEDLDGMYPAAAARAKQDAGFRDRARKATLALQSGQAAHRKIWQVMHDVSMVALKREFAALGVNFDLWNGESDADPFIPAMLEELRARNLLEHDQGAQVLRVARPDDKRPVPPLLVVSSEGSAMYGTTDLATIVQREQQLDPDLYLYVVDQRQADHFVQVFRAAEIAGWITAGTLEHVGFGTMNGPDGKPFKTRAGGVLKLNDLIQMVRDKASARLREAEIGSNLGAEEFASVAHMIAIATLKVADLQNFRGTSYVFDLDRFSSFEGKTGPYLLYAAVRIKSILRKAEAQSVMQGAIRVTNSSERDLVLALDAFEDALEAAYDKRAPHFVLEHAFALAQTFSAFYGCCPILPEPGAELRSSRLALAALTLRQLELALDLLGIETPERM